MLFLFPSFASLRRDTKPRGPPPGQTESQTYIGGGEGRERDPGLFPYDHCRDYVREKADNQSPEQIRWPCDLRVAWIELDLTETTFHAARTPDKTDDQDHRGACARMDHPPPTSLWFGCLPDAVEDLKRQVKGPAWPSAAPNVAKFFSWLPMLIVNLLRVSDDARCDPRDSALDLRRFLAKLRPRRRLGGTEAYRRDTRRVRVK